MAYRNNKLFNYLVNTFGLSRQRVEEYINTRLEELVGNHFKQSLNNSKYYEKLILDRVTHVITEGFPLRDYWYSKEKFDTYLQREIKKVIEAHIKENFDILIERKK